MFFPKADLNCLLCRDGKGRHPYSLSSGCPLPQPFPPLLDSRLSEVKILLLLRLPLVMRTLSFGNVSRTHYLSYLLLHLKDGLCLCWLTLTALFLGDFVLSFDPYVEELGYFILGVYYKSTLVLVLLYRF